MKPTKEMTHKELAAHFCMMDANAYRYFHWLSNPNCPTMKWWSRANATGVKLSDMHIQSAVRWQYLAVKTSRKTESTRGKRLS